MTPLEEAARAVHDGALVVIPTDTVYGLGCRTDDAGATARLFEAKRRPRDLELPVLVPSIQAANDVGVVDARARQLMEAFWPGPLTVIVPRREGSLGWDLGGDQTSVGLRRPRHMLASALLERTGPLAVTSANLSGHPTPASCEELSEVFGEAVAVYLCQEEALSGHPSTVVDVVHGEPRVVRVGGVSEEEIAQALQGAT